MVDANHWPQRRESARKSARAGVGMKRVIVLMLAGVLAAAGCKSTSNQAASDGVVQQAAAFQSAAATSSGVVPALATDSVTGSAQNALYQVDSPFANPGTCSH